MINIFMVLNTIYTSQILFLIALACCDNVTPIREKNHNLPPNHTKVTTSTMEGNDLSHNQIMPLQLVKPFTPNVNQKLFGPRGSRLQHLTLPLKLPSLNRAIWYCAAPQHPPDHIQPKEGLCLPKRPITYRPQVHLYGFASSGMCSHTSSQEVPCFLAFWLLG